MVIFKLNKLLEKHNIGQRELSRETGIRQATISDYVNNKAKHISVENLDILCEFFKCKTEDIIEYIEK
ncbi:MAG: helix-turn-helix transcriptional regulator [Clostridium sp.]|uniref:Helix-turn-helix transcriptional regulator n=1 Tax=Clostridium tertium TaxID=1559 RepID=A0A9X3XSH6_9CLOT|nr:MULTISPECIES: helix-turn-helix transcriptional regulator [Clostridium]MDC4242327.1 helix-turn-helix transcriptional regulator [Clostridium tertium]MDU7150156.1 helix-turn-helix transcriptional regulator [Clostridium sp.]MDU7243341.1 helix-turn-helix transcriptional regulator [Clostridium sp.]